MFFSFVNFICFSFMKMCWKTNYLFFPNFLILLAGKSLKTWKTNSRRVCGDNAKNEAFPALPIQNVPAPPPPPAAVPVLATFSPKKLPARLPLLEESSQEKIKAFSPEKSQIMVEEKFQPLDFGPDDFDAAMRKAFPSVGATAPPFGIAADCLRMPTDEELEDYPVFGNAPIPGAGLFYSGSDPAAPAAAFREYQLFPADAVPTRPIARQYPFMVTVTRQQEEDFRTFKTGMNEAGHFESEEIMCILAAEFGLIPQPFFLQTFTPDGSLRFGVSPLNFAVNFAPVPISGGDPLSPNYIFKVLSELGCAVGSNNEFAILYQVRECMNYMEYGSFKSMFEVAFPPLAAALKNHMEDAINKIESIYYGNGSPVSPTIKEDARIVAGFIKAANF
jgi:hypothetical protein